MLFHMSFRPKTGYTHNDQKSVFKLWENFLPPEGYEIKSFYMGTDGRGFAIIESTTAEAMYEALAIWAGVYVDYDIIPVVEIDKAVELTNKAIAKRESI